MIPKLTVEFTRTSGRGTFRVTAWSRCITAGGAILDVRQQVKRADLNAGERSTLQDFDVRPYRGH